MDSLATWPANLSQLISLVFHFHLPIETYCVIKNDTSKALYLVSEEIDSASFTLDCIDFFVAKILSIYLIFGCPESLWLRTGFVWLRWVGATLPWATLASHFGVFS